MRRIRTAAARIAFVATLALGVAAAGSAPAGAATTRTNMYRATNESRTDRSIKKVDIHYRISKLVRRHSVAMARRGSIFHTSASVIQNRYLDGIRWGTWGENVGVGGTVGGLQRAFMRSPGHRSNVLNRDFRRVAIGTYRDDDGLLWVTVFFYG